MKKMLILKNPDTKIVVKDDYIVVKNILNEYIVSFVHIEAIYINKVIDIKLIDLFSISTSVELYIIDQHGYLLGKITKERYDA